MWIAIDGAGTSVNPSNTNCWFVGAVATIVGWWRLWRSGDIMILQGRDRFPIVVENVTIQVRHGVQFVPTAVQRRVLVRLGHAQCGCGAIRSIHHVVIAVMVTDRPQRAF